jgi:tight adherence protein C
VTDTTVLLAASVVMAVAVALTVSGCGQRRPTVHQAVSDLRRGQLGPSATAPRRAGERMAVVLADRLPVVVPTASDLRLIGRTTEAHVLLIGSIAVLGLLGPGVVVAALRASGAVAPSLFIPAVGGVAAAVLGPALVHAATVERAAEARADLRHQLSAYLDVVTMLLAGNVGHEGALEEATRAGDGRLFRELARRGREITATGRSLVEALDEAGRDLDLDELRQVAATAALAATEGAPVARTLAAKCATVRSTLATDHETEARLRTSRLTAPIVGMALIFMALVIYPALGSP